MTTEPVRANTDPVDPFTFEDPRFAGVDTTIRKEDLPTGKDDGWFDPGFEAVRNTTSRKFVEDLGAIADDDPDSKAILDAEAAEAIAAATPLVPVPVVTAPVVVPTPVPDEPEVIEYEDGSSVTIEKTKRGWQATLDSNTSAGAEVFKGATKDEMWRNLAAGKINATRKIQSLNRQIKLGQILPDPAPVVQPRTRELTADEVFEIKTQLNNNPDLAFQNLFQKKTGMTLEQLVALAEKGNEANEKLRIEAEARQFRLDYPEYYPTDDNLHSLDSYLTKEKLEWNATNLGTAFEELSEAGLLDVAPKPAVPQPALALAPAPQSTPAAATPASVSAPAVTPAPATPPVPDPRIVGRRTGLRGSGIRQSDVTNVPTTIDPPPTDEELDNLSNDEINQLFAGVRRLRAQSARR